MFKSSQWAVVFPQSEHLRLVGALAYHWGNAEFDLPVAREALTAGMAFHDRAYGYVDNHAIGEISEQDWLEIARRGFGMQFSEPAADIIARMHRLWGTGLCRRLSTDFKTDYTDQAIIRQRLSEMSGGNHSKTACSHF